MPIPNCGPGECDHYGCKLRHKGIQIGTLAAPSKEKKGRLTPTQSRPDLGEVQYDERPNGTRMPILHPNGDPLRKGQARQMEHKVDEFRRKLNQSAPS